jgi:signal transduction histidine kinase
MKLWMKTAAVCATVLLAVVAVCSALLLAQAKYSLLELTAGQVREKQESLKTSFVSMMNYYLPENANEAVRHSMAVYCFSQFADETGVLLRDGETLVSQAAVQPEVLLPLDEQTAVNEQREYAGLWQGQQVMVAGSRTYMQSTYDVYVVQDVTAVYNQIADMTRRFVVISAAGVVLGTLLIVLLVRRASRPLGRLGLAAREITGGDYAKRAITGARDEVGRLAADFNRMADAVQAHVAQLEETARRQQLFIGGVTHEYKTPLTTLLLHADTLLNTKMSDEERERSLRHIYSQCEWLERLTQKLLKLLTLQEDIALREQPVKPLLDAVAQSMADLLEQRGTPLTVECRTDTLVFDFDLMRSLLANLADNASKASQPGQRIWLSAQANVIEVRDEGHGIQPEDLERVTEPFYMADRSRSKKHGGVGLGLALVRRIEEAHGARLELVSTPGQGTTARVIFPR